MNSDIHIWVKFTEGKKKTSVNWDSWVVSFKGQRDMCPRSEDMKVPVGQVVWGGRAALSGAVALRNNTIHVDLLSYGVAMHASHFQ